ncbi:MAG: hypothetical protein ACRDBY_05990 [Cetobacterium sp.]
MIFIFEIRLKNSDIAIDNVTGPVITLEENKAALLNFKISYFSNYFNKLEKFITRIEVFQINNDFSELKIYEGRVLDIKKSMDSNGNFLNEIICEGYLNYLLDTTVGVWEVHPAELPPDAPKYAEPNYDTKKFLEKILNNHNSKVEDNKKIYPGNITLITPIYCMTNRESSLGAIYDKLINKQGGFLNLRNENGKLYLDYLKDNPVTEENEIEIGINLRDIVSESALKTICTRLIAIGSESKITSIAEDSELIKKYGIVERVVEWKDVTIQENLDKKAQEKLVEINKDLDIAAITALDLSYVNKKFNEINLSQNINVSCDPLNYFEKHRIVKIALDLEKPWNSVFALNAPGASQVSETNSIIEETNNNKIEILQMNGKLIQKVSSSEFQSYREQTDKVISEKVSSTEFKTYKEQTDKDISQKVSSNDFSTLFKQNIEGFDFTIGNNTPLSIRKDSLIFKFSDGTTCTMDSSGFSWNRNGSSYPYHSCFYRGVINFVSSGSTVRAYLPDFMKGKRVEWGWENGNVIPERSGDLIYSFNVEDVTQDKSQCEYKDFKASLMVRDPNKENSPSWRGKLNIIYTLIA